MAALTHVGNSLLITRGKWRGWIGTIKEIKQLPCGLFDYVMEIDDSDEDTVNKIEVTIPADDCREYIPGNINLETPFDITNYLDVNQMRDIAKEVYTVKVTEYVDAILHNRKEAGCGNIVQQILTEVVNKYTTDMIDQYKDDFLKIFKKVINMDLPASGDEDEKCFARAIQWKLENCATEYIKDHPDEIVDVMKSKINDIAKDMISQKLSHSLSCVIESTATEVIKTVFTNTGGPLEEHPKHVG